MAKYAVNPEAVANCRRLIEARQYVLDSDWGSVQPARGGAERLSSRSTPGRSTRPGTSGLTEGAPDETKARYAFVVR